MYRLILFLFLFLLCGAAVNAEEVIVRGPAGAMITNQIGMGFRRLGASVDERNRLEVERRTNIKNLRGRLESCGNCADRAKIQSQLDYWTSLDKSVKAAESDALQQVGLGQYGSFREVQQKLMEALLNPNRPLTEKEKRERTISLVSAARNRYCEAKFQSLRGELHRQKLTECRNELDPTFLFVQGRAAASYCSEILKHVDKKMYPWLDDGWNLYGECLDENLPRRFLSKQAERMHEKEELGRVRGLIRNWCRSVGVPWTPDAQKSKDENLAEWRVGLAECLQSHEAADIIKSRETVEKACVEHPEERTAKPQVDTLICLQDKEPTRRMYREWDLARRAAIFKKQ